jgi:hypothetical protein
MGATLPEPRAPRALTADDDTRHWRADPTTTEMARRVHACDHYSAATEEPWRAVTSACPRHPLRARLRRLKRRARSARPLPRLWALKRPGSLLRK